ncbi:MAG: type II toxin-antitoxin system RelE/ParE family toxin [Nitrospiraceae bacterium]|nr:MAG: type II toxin-antitoxin system RelE/ParE family toxin [Nitrospiraceae bacterium]
MAPPAEQQLRTFAKPLRTILVKRLHALRIDSHPSCVMKLEGKDQLYRIHEGGYRTLCAIREQNPPRAFFQA